MQSRAVDVDAYLDEVPPDRRELLTSLRELCLQVLDGYEESMAYGMLSYTRDGEVELAFASQKKYVSLYVLKQDVLEAHRDRLADLNVGKGCIRYAPPAKVDLHVVRSMLEATAASAGPVC